MSTVVLKKTLVEGILAHLAKQPISSGLTSLHDEIEKEMTKPVEEVKSKGKALPVKGVSPMKLAREFLANNKDATVQNIKDYLVSKKVKENTANTTAFNVMKAVKTSD